MLRPPLAHRRKVPFYTEKSEAEFRADPYEDYGAMVVRQLCLHYGDLANDQVQLRQAGRAVVNHPWTTLHKWLLEKVDLTTGPIVEIGCGSGRLSGELAQHKPEQAVYGFDYSYQLLRAATDYWLESQQLKWQFPRGYAQAFLVPARAPLENLHFGLARAEQLPLPDDSVGVLVGSFLLDRLADPLLALAEWYRVLRSGGYLLLASPLNFQSKAHWESFHPFEKWLDCCREAGWKVKAHPPKISLQEPLDQQGNAVLWQCERLLLQKP